MIEQEVNIDKIQLTSSDRHYLQHKRCFTFCIDKQFKEPNLKDDQKVCIRNCLGKYKDAQKFMVDKIHRTMQTLIRSDMNLMAAYKDQQGKKHP